MQLRHSPATSLPDWPPSLLHLRCECHVPPAVPIGIRSRGTCPCVSHPSVIPSGPRRLVPRWLWCLALLRQQRRVRDLVPPIMIRSLLFFAALKGASCVQPEAPPARAAPLRELPWAQLNFLHTTDVHGWWGGHLQEYVQHRMTVAFTSPKSPSFQHCALTVLQSLILG
jgi:hypothetical protein